jgi:uncharacterized protein YraI
MNTGRFGLILLTGILILACSFPATLNAVTAPTAAVQVLPADAGITPQLADEPATEPATVSAPPAAACKPQLSANSPVNVRSGPGTEYDAIGALNTGQTTAIDGKNDDGTWWYIVFPSGPAGHGWVAASVTTATCNPTTVAVVAAPPTPVPPTEVIAQVTGASVWVDPDTIGVAGCMGPIQPSSAGATIEVTGPMKVKWHFVTQQTGNLPSHTTNFNKAGSKDVSDTFVPPLHAGTYWVKLVIEGVDTSGWDVQTKYKISC